MAKANGYGMDALGARKPSHMPKKKASPDSGKPAAQYSNPTGPGKPGGNSPDSGKPRENQS